MAETAHRPNTESKICVVGLGYTGLPTAAVLASRGFDVHGVEARPEVVETINQGGVHIAEPELDILVRAAVQTGKLRAHAEPTPSDVFLLCVPTPVTPDHNADLSFVFAAVDAIAPHLQEGNLVILESTSPPGTTEEIAERLAERTGIAQSELRVAHAPERVLPGKILREVVENDRIIGGVDDASTQDCADFYRSFVTGELLLTNSRTAETVKLVENAYRDVNIAFANELSQLAGELEVDVWEVIRMANRHPRVEILTPGPGVGGHCIAVDPWFLISKVPDKSRLLRAAREVNDGKPHWVVDRVAQKASRFREPSIACLGLTYKPDVDDIRESPALEIVRALRDAKVGELRVVEPFLASHPEFELMSVEQALAGVDIVLFLVGHRAFERIPRLLLEEKTIIDVCGALRQ